MRRLYIIIIIFIVVVFAGFFYFKSFTAKEVEVNEVIILGTSYWPGQYWIDMANTKGWFQEADVPVRVVNTQEDYYGSIDDLLSGKLDLQILALSDVMEINSRGANLVMILPTDVSLDGEGLVVQPEIKTISLLKGKRVGVESGEVFSEMLLDVVLSRAKLTRNDIEMVMISPERANGLFFEKKIDAVVTWDPYLSELVNKDGRLLFTVRDIGGSISGLVGKKDFIDSHKNEIAKVIEVWKRATEYIAKNKTETYAIVSAQYKSTLGEAEEMDLRDLVFSPEDVKKVMDDNTSEYSLLKAVETLRKYIDKDSENNLLDISSFIDNQFVKAL